MNYRLRQKERKTKLILKKIFQTLSFRSQHLSFGGQTVFFGSIALLISLFLPWMSDTEKNISLNAFSSINGNIGYIILCFVFIISFLLFSNNSKDKIKLHAKISFQNHLLILLFGIFTIFSCIVTLSCISGIQKLYSENIVYQEGGILALSSGIIILFGSYALRKEYLNNNLGIFVDNNENTITKVDKKNNMTLPF